MKTKWIFVARKCLDKFCFQKPSTKMSRRECFWNEILNSPNIHLNFDSSGSFAKGFYEFAAGFCSLIQSISIHTCAHRTIEFEFYSHGNVSNSHWKCFPCKHLIMFKPFSDWVNQPKQEKFNRKHQSRKFGIRKMQSYFGKKFHFKWISCFSFVI